MPTTEELAESLGNLTVMQICELTKTLEKQWGVTAAAPVVQQAPPPPDERRTKEPEQTEFAVVLVSSGEKRIEVIKVVRAAIGLGLKEAKELVEKDGTKTIKEAMTKADAEELKASLEAAGAKVLLQ